MSLFTNLFSGGIGEVADKVTGGLDKLFTSDEERLTLQNKKASIKAEVEMKLTEVESQLETYIQKHLTERHKVDMQSDSWLSKNIRPVALITISVGLGVVLTLSYWGKTPTEPLVTALVEAWKLVLMFYFGGRSIEKGVSMISKALKR